MSREAFTTEFFYSEGSAQENDRLSLYITPLSFLFARFSKEGLVTALVEVKLTEGGNNADMLSLLLSNYGLNKTRFGRVDIALLNNSFTLVPEAYASVSDVRTLIGFNTGASVTRSIRHIVGEAEFCYTADQEMLSALERTFPAASLRHSGAVMINLFFNHHSLKDKDVFMNVSEGFVEIVAKEGSRLSFYNVFKYSTNEDLLYYLLFTMEQLEKDPLNTRLAVTAQKKADDELMKALKKYLKHVHFCVHDPSVKLHGEPASLPGHYYFILLNQHLCEL